MVVSCSLRSKTKFSIEKSKKCIEKHQNCVILFFCFLMKKLFIFDRREHAKIIFMSQKFLQKHIKQMHFTTNLLVDGSYIKSSNACLKFYNAKIEENDNSYDDIDIWFPYKLNSNTRNGFMFNSYGARKAYIFLLFFKIFSDFFVIFSSYFDFLVIFEIFTREIYRDLNR